MKNLSFRHRAQAMLTIATISALMSACGGGGGGGSSNGGSGSGSGGTTPPAAPAPTTVASAPTPLAQSGIPLDTSPSHPIVSLVSDPGDYVGSGRSYAFDDGNANIDVRVTGTHLRISVQGDQTWEGNFQLPASVGQWQVGTFGGLTRYPFNLAATGGMDWSGDARGCNMLEATMTVNSVRYDAAGELAAINFDFVQHCEGASPALRGHVDWDSQRLVTAAAPVVPIPAGLWSPAAGEMPASANAMFFISDPLDYIGQGWSFTVTGAPAGTLPPPSPGNTQDSAVLSITESGGLLVVTMEGDHVSWRGQFKAMDGLARLQPGYYGIVKRYPFHNPKKGGMSWSMDSRGCNQLDGWFAIDSISYVGDKVSAVDMRFAQYCDNLVNALRGRIRWTLTSTAAQ